jgi:MFS family permease
MRLPHVGNVRQPDAPAPHPVPGLDWLNFFVANFQTGFGPFISVYLTSAGWTQGAIGAALSTGTIASMASQVPAGALVDAAASKRMAAGAAISAIGVSALAIALWPNLLAIAAAEVLHSFASAILGPAIAAITLVLVDSSAFGERLGRNARYAAIGNAVAAGLMGVCASYVGDRAVFLFAAALAIPALAALATLRETDCAPLRSWSSTSTPPRVPARPPARSLQFLTDRRLVAFAVCAVLFHLANAAMLPIAAAAVTKRAAGEAGLIIAACIVGPQLITAILSPWAGRAAETWGRRPILLLGFSALPIRGVLLACIADPYLIVAIQLFDGLGAAVFGVLFPLIVAAVTRDTGHYTTSLGLVGLAIGGGATLSTVLAGLVADDFGVGAAFLSLSAVGLIATAWVWTFMPETRAATDG